MKVIKSPTELYYTNFAIVSPQDFNDPIEYAYVELKTGVGTFIFSIKKSEEVPAGSIGFNLLQREWAALFLNQDIDVRPFVVDTTRYELITIVLEDFIPERKFLEPYDVDDMADAFLLQFNMQSLSIGQKVFFRFQEQIMLVLVKDLEVMVRNNTTSNGWKDSKDIITRKSQMGFCYCCPPKKVVTIVKAEGSSN